MASDTAPKRETPLRGIKERRLFFNSTPATMGMLDEYHSVDALRKF